VTISNGTPRTILFLCVHNARCSQMAAGFARHLGGDNIRVYSGGSEPADRINPAAIAATAEIGIGPTKSSPQPTLSSPWDAATPARSSLTSVMSTGTSATPRQRRGTRSTHKRRNRATIPKTPNQSRYRTHLEERRFISVVRSVIKSPACQGQGFATPCRNGEPGPRR
jgi:hypothetical protein